MTADRTLVICIALNHYDRIYAANVRSHRHYAARHGYAYMLVRKPRWATVKEAVWLKIALIDAALAAGWDWVLFLDVDCELRTAAPAIQSVAADGKEIYLAPGFSGNVNSGVIVARNGARAREFFQTVLAAADTTVPEQDWGENGHVIHFARSCSALGLLDRRWNNNADPALADFIRHYSAGGPMRPLYPFTAAARALTLLVRVVNKARKLAGRHDVPAGDLVARLLALREATIRRYPELLGAAAAHRPAERVAPALA